MTPRIRGAGAERGERVIDALLSPTRSKLPMPPDAQRAASGTQPAAAAAQPDHRADRSRTRPPLAPPAQQQPSLSARRMANQPSSPNSAPAPASPSASTPTGHKSAAATPPLALDIPAAQTISAADGSVQVPLKQSTEPREAGQPSLNATANPLPTQPSGVTPPLTTSSANRSGTSPVPPPVGAGKAGKQSKASTQNEADDQGYEGEVESHRRDGSGAAQGADDDDSDDTATEQGNAGGARRPALNKRGDSGAIQGHDFIEPPPPGRLPRQQQQSDGQRQQQYEQEKPTQRNRNPSQASHAHPTLPLRPGKNGGGAKVRSSSISSARSVEATSHPFPTPGIKQNNGFQFDKWKSVEEQRLDEDERREKHWKRWGPYLSERQWVRYDAVFAFSVSQNSQTDPDPSPPGHRPRGLLGQRRRLDAFPARPRAVACVPLG